ncbi:MAG: NADH pyrophosphatase, partial [Actinobacteria bacterium]|nr:NADH pyrophosphatase [Actinomycetota bacterium]
MDSDRQLLGNLILARGEVDRAAERRADAAWLATHRADPASRVMLVCDGGARVLRRADGSA